MKAVHIRITLLSLALVMALSGLFLWQQLRMEGHAGRFAELLHRLHALDMGMELEIERLGGLRSVDLTALRQMPEQMRTLCAQLETQAQYLGADTLIKAVEAYRRGLRKKIDWLEQSVQDAAILKAGFKALLAPDTAEPLPAHWRGRLLAMQLFPEQWSPQNLLQQARDEAVANHPLIGPLLTASLGLRERIVASRNLHSQQQYLALHRQFVQYRARQKQMSLMLGAALLTLILAMAFALWRSWRHLRRTQRAAECVCRRLEDGVNSLGEGFALFDNQDRLVLVNDTLARFYPWLDGVLQPGTHRKRIEKLNAAHLHRTALHEPSDTQGTGGSWLELSERGDWFLANDRPTREGGMVWVRTDVSRARAAELELRKLGRALEQSPVSVVIADVNGVVEYVNPKFESTTGRQRDEVVGQRLSLIEGANMDGQAYARMWATLLAGKEWHGVFQRQDQQDKPRWELARISPVRDDRGEITHFIGIKEDITPIKAYEESQRLSATVFEATTEGIILTDATGCIRTVNPAFTRITGFSAEEVVGRPASIFDATMDPATAERIKTELANHDRWSGEITAHRKDGSWYHQWISITTLHDEHQAPAGYVIIFSDISQHKADRARILYQANYDLLTGLPNRTLLMDRLRQGLLSAQRQGHKLAVLFIDLDRFKAVNDLHGHGTGDELLQQVAQRFKSLVRAMDTVARFGGDEFVVLLHNLEQDEGAAVVATKIIDAIGQPFELKARTVNIGASVGISIYPDDVADELEMEQVASLLLSNADMAMYQAKASGRNGFQFFEPRMQEEIKDNLALEQALRSAVKHKALEVYYQPIMDGLGERMVGVEALVRWNDPWFGAVAPERFIRLAEETGLIHDIGSWVFQQACRQLSEWRHRHGLEIYLSLNLSARQRDLGMTPQMLQGLLQAYELKPDWITLEITENILLEEVEAVIEWLNDLKQVGVKLSVDDFGTGYSSLSCLKQFPVDALKVDKSFVMALPDDRDGSSLVCAIIAMADSLGLEVVAEGVESENQRLFLLKLGCRYMQGYLFEQPVPANEITDYYWRLRRARKEALRKV